MEKNNVSQPRWVSIFFFFLFFFLHFFLSPVLFCLLLLLFFLRCDPSQLFLSFCLSFNTAFFFFFVAVSLQVSP